MAISHYTPPILLLFLLSSSPTFSFAVNITAILSAYPEFSGFNRLLSTTGVGAELSDRSSLTLLAVPNSFLLHCSDTSDVSDVLRYHVLLQYLSWPDLRRLPPSGKLITTLYQTTGRAVADLGSLNLTRDSSTGLVVAHSPVPFSSSNATVLSQIRTLPYNVTILSVDALLVPYGSDLAASETQPTPFGLNITKILADGRDFNVAASMLEASGVVEEFENDERGAGITVFVPTDEAFGELPATERLQSLTADRKAVVLRFHVLHSYYPLGSLESIVNPVQPTLATEGVGAGRFTLNISRVNGSVAIDTGLVQASITRTVFDQNPMAVFAVSRVLLPKEIFGKEATTVPGGEISAATAPPPARGGEMATEEAPAPVASSPQAIKGEVTSGVSGGVNVGNFICTAVILLLLCLLLV
ncbi:fasciclin-like arabinogalactan protein 4 isoform X6 [Iris pallida]|uniref:Fasciclin-like arabinogalactan protein 4 isoform X6 n=1 Tax=Iris pallida TaxID=29817 RepID=A0AAX6EHP5_IRIPA|nr:fasciclin-like arabinogalactan protein 4 isoform X6 [Iris pallida]KAJ6815077.1 fasciclin-like arabinogalactan protein 4 isoform X6 [Iris pallida]